MIDIKHIQYPYSAILLTLKRNSIDTLYRNYKVIMLNKAKEVKLNDSIYYKTLVIANQSVATDTQSESGSGYGGVGRFAKKCREALWGCWMYSICMT